MSKRTVVLSALALSLSLVPVAGGSPSTRTRKERTETQVYFSHGVRTSHEDQGLGTEENYAEPIRFVPRRGERTVTLNLSDVAGTPIVVRVTQADPKGGEPIDAEFCGTEDRFVLVSDEPVEVHVYSGICVNHTWGFASVGEITATFSKARPKHPHQDHDHDH